MHKLSIKDQLIVIKNPMNGNDAIWIHLYWDEDLNDYIFLDCTLIPPHRKIVKGIFERVMGYSNNQEELIHNVEVIKNDILKLYGIEKQFIPVDYINEYGDADIKKYKKHFEWSWNMEDFLVPLIPKKTYYSNRSDLYDLCDFFRGKYNPKQLKALNRNQYISFLYTPELLSNFLKDYSKEKSKFFLYNNSQGNYLFHHVIGLETVFLIENKHLHY